MRIGKLHIRRWQGKADRLKYRYIGFSHTWVITPFRCGKYHNILSLFVRWSTL